MLDETASKTSKSAGVMDVVCEERDKQLIVTETRRGGGTAVASGNFVLQGVASILQDVSLGDVVTINYRDLDLENIKSAITIGPSVTHFEHEDDHLINHDKSLGDNPPFTNRRMARSVVYKTKENIVFEIFDGAPKTKLFKGVTPKEVAEILNQECLDLEWAYFLDPGQSARLAVRHPDNTIEGFGNRHYVRWPKLPNHPYVWAGEHGREVPSVVYAKINNNDK